MPRRIALHFALLLSGSAALAAPPPLAAACQACHGADGVSAAADIPNLAGQKKDYLANQLKAFRDGTRKNELMAAIAAQLRDTDVTELAAFWSSLPAASAGSAVAAVPSRVVFPANFPQGFTEYKRDDDAGSRTVGRAWANAVALQAAREGRPLPDGAMIVVANHAARLGADGKPLTDAQGRLVPEDRPQSYSAMAAGAGWGDGVPALLRNGNWHYALFTAAGAPRASELHPRCLACHQPQAAASHVFSIKALQAAARGG